MSSETQSSILVGLVGVLLIIGLWFLAISPKRSERAQVASTVAAQQGRLDAAKAQVASYTTSRRQFPGLLSELKRLDAAVPSRGAISSLLRQLQGRARLRDSHLRLAALKDPSAAAGATAGTAGQQAPVTPGATAGPGGLATLPFTFEYTGEYFDLVGILAAVRRNVTVTSGDLKIDGRLLTVDGLTFQRTQDGSTTKAIVNATAYIAPDGAPAPPTPAVPAIPAAATPNGGS